MLKKIKLQLITVVHKTNLGHPAAHIGIESNERAKFPAKAAKEIPAIELEIPVFFSPVSNES